MKHIKAIQMEMLHFIKPQCYLTSILNPVDLKVGLQLFRHARCSRWLCVLPSRIPRRALGARANPRRHRLSGSPTQAIHGKPIARMGDQVSCPIKGHGVNAIVEGDPDYKVNGMPVALEGHKTACGCSLIGSVSAMRGGPSSPSIANAITNTDGTFNSKFQVLSLKPPLSNNSYSDDGNISDQLESNVSVVIRLTRKWETTESTIGVFSIDGTDINGFILEEKGPSTLKSGLEQRVPQGEYELVWHQGRRFVKALRLRNSEVSDARAILIHAGNTAKDTEGCLLPGSGRAKNSVTGSQPMVKKIYSHIEAKGFVGGRFKDGAQVNGGAKIIILEDFQK